MVPRSQTVFGLNSVWAALVPLVTPLATAQSTALA